MKKLSILVTVLILCVAFTATAAVDPDTLADEANSVRQARSVDLWFDKWGFKVSRGLINCGTCWVELPRTLWVETKANPIVGPPKGLFKGLGLTFARAVAGVMDLGTLGTVDDMYTLYDQYRLPYFVWQDYSKAER